MFIKVCKSNKYQMIIWIVVKCRSSHSKMCHLQERNTCIPTLVLIPKRNRIVVTVVHLVINHSLISQIWRFILESTQRRNSSVDKFVQFVYNEEKLTTTKIHVLRTSYIGHSRETFEMLIFAQSVCNKRTLAISWSNSYKKIILTWIPISGTIYGSNYFKVNLLKKSWSNKNLRKR
jgi:hypothetical protein